MITKDVDAVSLLNAAQRINGGGINESLPMTIRPVSLSKKQRQKDSDIAKELIYLADVKGDLRALVAAFYEYRNKLSHPRYWDLLRTVWITAGMPENYELFRSLFSSKRPFRYFVMTPEDEAFLGALPNEITVWRASKGPEDRGLSWTLDEKFAAEYAEKKGRVLIERQVQKKDVFAYFNRRGESEIIIL